MILQRLVLLALLLAPASPPGTRVERLRADVESLAADEMAGRATGTDGAALARAYLLRQLREIGAEPLVGDSLEQAFDARPRGATETVRGVNLVGIVPAAAGSADGDDGPAIVLTAHYDHLGIRGGAIFNGADDNASGVAALLEVARGLAAASPARAVGFAFLDAEEHGLQGARHLVETLRSAGRLPRLNINLDMVGRSDAGRLFVAGTSHSPELAPHVRAAAGDLPVALGHDTGGGPDDWTLASDHAAFHRAGVDFLYLGVEDHADYHRPTDDADEVDIEFLAQVVTFVEGLLGELSGARVSGPGS